MILSDQAAVSSDILTFFFVFSGTGKFRAFTSVYNITISIYSHLNMFLLFITGV